MISKQANIEIILICRKDPDELQEVTLGERDWIQWWMWALHYALWNMDATDEAIAREQEDKENTTATLTRKGKFYLLSKLAVCSCNTRLNDIIQRFFQHREQREHRNNTRM